MTDIQNTQNTQNIQDTQNSGIKRRTIKSFVLREGRITDAQKRILGELDQDASAYFIQNELANLKDSNLKDSNLPDSNITDSNPIKPNPAKPKLWDLDKLFNRNNLKRTLEIGFGNGASLAQMAQNDPERDFLGLEVHRAGVGHLLLDLHDKNLSNVRASSTDAIEVLKHKLADQSFDCVQIFFPDPWHKKRHNKRRLIQTDFLELLYPILQKGGILHCATDWQPYALHIMQILNESSLFENIHPDYAPRPISRPLTKFEARGLRLGHGVWDIMFKKV